MIAVADPHGQKLEIGDPVMAWGDEPAIVRDIVDGDEGGMPSVRVEFTAALYQGEHEVFSTRHREDDYGGAVICDELEAVTG